MVLKGNKENTVQVTSSCLKERCENYKLFGTFLLILVVLDACLSGGGRILNLGPISLRMILFTFGLAYVCYGLLVHKKTIYGPFARVTVIFIILTLLSIIIGLEGHTPINSILNEIKPKIYFLSLLFFSVVIADRKHIELVSRLIEFSAVAISTIFIAIFIMWKSGILDYEILHNLLNPNDDPSREFIFRNDITFYFKSLVYVAIGVFFFLSKENQAKRFLLISILLLAIAFTMTRGVWLAVFLTLALYAAQLPKAWSIRIFYSSTAVCIGVVFVFYVSSILPAAHISDSDKLNDINLLTGITKNSFSLFQYIFGAGAGYRTPTPIEITYLDIFFKFGAVGLFFWVFPIFYILRKTQSIHAEYKKIITPYVLSSIFIYTVSFTNNFLTNPIGMAIVLITMVVVQRQASYEYHAC